jgi:hypothetical protein
VTDLILLAAMVTFFAVAVLFVRACERIVGADAEPERLDTESREREETVA